MKKKIIFSEGETEFLWWCVGEWGLSGRGKGWGEGKARRSSIIRKRLELAGSKY